MASYEIGTLKDKQNYIEPIYFQVKPFLLELHPNHFYSNVNYKIGLALYLK